MRGILIFGVVSGLPMICKDFLVLLSFKRVAQPLRSTPQSSSYPTLGRALHLHGDR